MATFVTAAVVDGITGLSAGWLEAVYFVGVLIYVLLPTIAVWVILHTMIRSRRSTPSTLAARSGGMALATLPLGGAIGAHNYIMAASVYGHYGTWDVLQFTFGMVMMFGLFVGVVWVLSFVVILLVRDVERGRTERSDEAAPDDRDMRVDQRSGRPRAARSAGSRSR